MMPSGTTITKASAASLTELISAARMKGSTAVWYVYDVPMLPCSSPPIQLRYWVISGRFTPRCWSRACTALFAANGPRMKRPGSPGKDLAAEEYHQAEEPQREDHQP